MTMFLAELVFIFELALFSSGLIILHYGKRESTKLIKIAAYIMIVGSLLTTICTSYYSLKYYNQGAFDSFMSHELFAPVDDKGPLHHYHPVEWNGPTDGGE